MIEPLYIIVRLDYHDVRTQKDRNLGVETLGYTRSKQTGLKFLEMVAAREIHGFSWSYDAQGPDPFYDPENEDNIPPPSTTYGIWDEDIEEMDSMLDRPSSVINSVSIFVPKIQDGKRHHVIFRSYKLCLTNPCVDDMVAVQTAADSEMYRQMFEESVIINKNE